MRNVLIIFLLLISTGCSDEYTPKPYGYFRIDFPDKSYKPLNGQFPYNFDISTNAVVKADQMPEAEKYWLNIFYPAYNAEIHLSYKQITADTSLAGFMQDCHRMAYAHTVKAESIKEHFFQGKNGLFGLVYYIEGNTASSTQFFITDSTRHFLRGSLYFNQRPNKDSLAPIIDYLQLDIINLMETTTFGSDTKKSRADTGFDALK